MRAIGPRSPPARFAGADGKLAGATAYDANTEESRDVAFGAHYFFVGIAPPSTIISFTAISGGDRWHDAA